MFWAGSLLTSSRRITGFDRHVNQNILGLDQLFSRPSATRFAESRITPVSHPVSVPLAADGLLGYSPVMITIVSGLPRSGTSLLMQMVQAGGIPALTDAQRAADEDNPRGYLELEAVKRTKHDPSWLSAAEGRVVKMVHLLLYDLPADRAYRVLFTRRNLREVIASQRKMLERHGKSGASMSDDQLIEVFDAQLQKLAAWLAGQRHIAVLEVAYNELLSDAAPVVHRINEFLGGNLDESKMLGAIDPALYRNRAG